MFNNLSLSYPVALYVIAWIAMFYFFVIRKKNYGIGAIIIGAYMLSAFFLSILCKEGPILRLFM